MRCACGGTETAEHVLLECPLELDGRRRQNVQLVKVGLRWPDRMEEIQNMAADQEWWTALQNFAAGVRRLRADQQEEQH